jgi:hypothetical protein
MNKRFPKLEDLSVSSTTAEEMSLVLPKTLQAPNLRRLTLYGVDLPIGPSLLTSTTGLSTLSLTHIRYSRYVRPQYLVTQLQGLPHLEELSIGFTSPVSLSNSEGLGEEPLSALTPPVTQLTQPSLRRLTFRGVDDYLDDLVARINTPLLEQLDLTLLFDPAFTLTNLTKFIHRTKGFGFLVSRVSFNKDGPSIDLCHYEQRGIKKISIHVDCKPLDWQIDSATQVCSALGKIMSAVEDLTLDLDVDGMPSDWENSTLDSMLWHELLLPFIGVKKLHIGSSLTLELSEALQPDAGGLVRELLPQLQELEVQLEIDHAKQAFSAFIETRESGVGRPVHLLVPPIPHAVVHDIDPTEFLEYMEHVDSDGTDRDSATQPTPDLASSPKTGASHPSPSRPPKVQYIDRDHIRPSSKPSSQVPPKASRRSSNKGFGRPGTSLKLMQLRRLGYKG